MLMGGVQGRCCLPLHGLVVRGFGNCHDQPPPCIWTRYPLSPPFPDLFTLLIALQDFTMDLDAVEILGRSGDHQLRNAATSRHPIFWGLPPARGLLSANTGRGE